MKKLLILFTILGMLNNISHAQTLPFYISKDSMDASPDPAAYYFSALYDDIDMSDTIENSGNKDALRHYDYWLERLPTGIAEPFKEYARAKALASQPNSCPLPPDVFNGNWANTGPITNALAQGNVSAIYAVDNNPNIVFIGVESGGLWRTLDGGANWTCLSDGFNNNNASISVTDITVNPNNANDIYVGTSMFGDGYRNFMSWGYGQGIWRSIDGGNTWNLETGGPLLGTTADFFETTHLVHCPNLINNTDEMLWGLHGGQRQIIRKIGTGVWEDITPLVVAAAAASATPWEPLSPIMDIEFADDIPNSASEGTVYITTAFTYSGSLIPDAHVYEIKFDMVTGTINSVVSLLDHTVPINFGGAVGNSLMSNSQVTYVGNGELYALVDAEIPTWQSHFAVLHYDGTNWNTSNPIANNINDNNGVTFNDKSMMEIKSSKENKDKIYLGCSIPIVVEQNGSIWTWQTLQSYFAINANTHPDIRSVFLQKNGAAPDKVFWGHDGGLSRSDDDGSDYTGMNGNNLYTAHCYDVDVSNAGTKRTSAAMHNRLFTTANNTNWQNLDWGDGFDSRYDERSNHSNQRIFYHFNSDWHTYDHSDLGPLAGPTFTEPLKPGIDVTRPFPFPDDFDIQPSNPPGVDLMYMANRNLWFTNETQIDPGDWTEDTDDGDLSSDLSNPSTAKACAIAPSNPDTKYFLQKKRDEHLTVLSERQLFGRDNGANWKRIKTTDALPTNPFMNDANITDIVVDYNNENRIFVSVGMLNWAGPEISRVIVCNDAFPATGDPAWVDMSTGLTELPVTCLVYQAGSDDIIYAGTDAGVYRWDKALGCWIYFNGGVDPAVPMPRVPVQDMEIDYCNKKLVIATYGRGIWETDLYEPNHHVTNEIVGNVVWPTGDKYIKGDVRIRSGSMLSIQGVPDMVNNTSTTTVYMSKDSKFIVEPGAKLKVKGAHITSDCGNWHGIVTEGNNNFPQTLSFYSGVGWLYNNHGWVEINASIIEHAQEALNNFDGGNPSTSGGVIWGLGSKFINNRRSAQFMQFANSPGGVQQADESRFSDCKFYTNDDARYPFFSHITMWDVKGVPINNCEFYNTSDLSHSHEDAIITMDASYSIDNSTIKGFYKGINSSWFSLWNPPLSQITIRQNNFDENEIGLYTSNVWYMNIFDNYFKIGAKQTPVPPGSYQYYSIGSKLVNASLFAYCENVHDKTYNPPDANCTFQYTSGTEVYNTGAFDQLIDKNHYKWLYVGNDAAYTCGGIDPNTGVQVGLNYSCNSNTENTGWDFILQADAIVRETQTYGFNSGQATGNIFSTPALDWDHVSGNLPVRYHHANVGIHTPSSPIPLTCIPVNAGNVPECEDGYICGGTEQERMTDNENGGYGSQELQQRKVDFYQAETNYNSAKTAYNLLIDDGNTPQTKQTIENSTTANMIQVRAEMLSNSPYVSEEVLLKLAEENIMTDAIMLEILLANPEATRSEGFLEYLEYNAPNPLPSYMINLIRASWTGASSRAGLEENLSSFIAKMTQTSNDVYLVYSHDSLLRNKDSAFVWMQKVPSLRGQYRMIEYWLKNNNVIQAESILNGLPTYWEMTSQESKDYQSYVQLFNFKKALKNSNTSIAQLDTNQIAQLKVIADNADFSIGRGMARSALCFFYNICYPVEQSTYSQTNNRSTNLINGEERTSNLNVYPNPAKDHVTFEVRNPDKKCVHCMIRITDLQGREIYVGELDELSSMHIWDTRNVAPGTYLYQVKTNDNVESGKVVIVK